MLHSGFRYGFMLAALITTAHATPSQARDVEQLSRDQVLACTSPLKGSRRAATLKQTNGPWAKARAEAIRGFDPAGSIIDAAAYRERKWREALILLREGRGPEDPETIQALTNLAGSVSAQGRLAEAEPLYAEAAAYISERPPIGTLSSGVYASIGWLYYRQGRLPQAFEMLVKAAQNSFVADGPLEQARFASLIGLASSNYLHDGTAVSACFARAKKLVESTIGLYDQEVVASFIAELSGRLFDVSIEARQFTLSEDIARRGLSLSKEYPRSVNRAQFHRLLGEALIRQRRFDEAELTLGKSTDERLSLLGDVPDVELALSFSKLSNARLQQNGRQELALLAGRAALDQALALRRAGRDVPEQKVADFSALSLTHDVFLVSATAFADAAWANIGGKGADSVALTDAAFKALQEITTSRAARALKAAQARRSSANDAVAASLRHYEDLQLAAQANRDDSTVALASNQTLVVQQKAAEYKLLTSQIASVRSEIQAVDPTFLQLVEPKPLGIKEVRSRLKSDEAFVFFSPLQDSLHIFLISKAGVEWIRADEKRDSVESAVRSILCSVDEAKCSQVSKAATADWNFDYNGAFSIYKALFGGIEDKLKGVQRLFVVAQGPLASLPLQVLPTRKATAEQSREDNLWLADRFAITTLPAVAVFEGTASVSPSSRREGTGTFIGYGAPSLSEGAGEARGAPVLTLIGSAGTQVDPSTLRSLPALPGTETEIRASAEIMHAPEEALRLGPKMTEGSFRIDPAVSSARLVIIATHGLLPGDIPQLPEPGLVFSPPQIASRVDDGFLAASEASQLRLSADLLVLSACNTAASSGEDLYILARSFLYAGSKAVLGSHWRVSDEATAALTREMLIARRAHLTRSQALQAAIKAVRSGVRSDGSRLSDWVSAWSDPIAWGPFSLIASQDE